MTPSFDLLVPSAGPDAGLWLVQLCAATDMPGMVQYSEPKWIQFKDLPKIARTELGEFHSRRPPSPLIPGKMHKKCSKGSITIVCDRLSKGKVTLTRMKAHTEDERFEQPTVKLSDPEGLFKAVRKLAQEPPIKKSRSR
jgi:hypothetical protein